MRKSHKIILISVIALVTLGLISNFSNFFGSSGARRYRSQNLKPANREQPKEPTSDELKVERSTDNKTISYLGFEGKTALALLKLVGHVETKNFGELGDMVTAIDGIAADEKHFWALYVNGDQSQVGASQYVTKTGDKIEWKYEIIK